MKLKINTLLISGVSLVLGILLVALGFVVYKSYAYKGEIASFLKASRDAEVIASRQTALQKNLQGSKAAIDAIDARFVRETEVSLFIDMLEREADIKGVTANIGSISLDAAASAGGLKALRMRIDGTGTWAQVIRFTSALESLPYALRVETASVEKVSSDDTSSGSWRFVIDLRQYVSQ
ncbi:MAG: hypothetical protein Q8L64_06875 [bacterium]|nr:hypothetical protein [bacterium]